MLATPTGAEFWKKGKTWGEATTQLFVIIFKTILHCFTDFADCFLFEKRHSHEKNAATNPLRTRLNSEASSVSHLLCFSSRNKLKTLQIWKYYLSSLVHVMLREQARLQKKFSLLINLYLTYQKHSPRDESSPLLQKFQRVLMTWLSMTFS